MQEAKTQAPLAVMPMDYATADTQGAIGSMFQRALFQAFRQRDLDSSAITLVTHVIVDPADPAFSRPTSRSVRFMTKPRPKTWPGAWAGKLPRIPAGAGAGWFLPPARCQSWNWPTFPTCPARDGW